MIEGLANLLAVIRKGSSLLELLEGGGVAAILSDIELNAAAQAFRNVDIANDTRSQLWSGISHLESAYEAFAEMLRRDKHSIKQGWIGNMVRENERINKGELVLCLLAICYKALTSSFKTRFF